MNPIMKCCGYYCSCILLVSFAFYGILIGLLMQGNKWLTRDFPHEIDAKVDAVIIALIVNGVCFILCVGCMVVGKIQENKKLKETKEDDDFNVHVKQNQ